MSSLLELSARALLDRIAGSEPTPGGGSAAALAGAAGAALVQMVASMTKTRTGSLEERARLDAALQVAREALTALQRLVDDDSLAYDAVVAAYKLPKGSDDEKAVRRAAIVEAMRRATEVPLDTAETCLRALKAAQEAAAHGNPNAVSDARTGAALAWAGLLGALENVRINANPEAPFGAESLQKADALQREAQQRAGALGFYR